MDDLHKYKLRKIKINYVTFNLIKIHYVNF